MKILFVSSGNSETGISPIVHRQGQSILAKGLDVRYFTIKGKGLKGYLSNLKKLQSIIIAFQPDIVHAHYSMSAYLASLAGAHPLVVSLMGSDVNSAKGSAWLIRLMARFRWRHVILKTEEMHNRLEIEGCSIIPNGVDTDVFSPMEKTSCREKLRWSADGKHILFAANPSRPEKNYNLAIQALDLLQEAKIELHVFKDVPPADIPLWMNAAEIIILPSLREGSPNVVKEAMSCCRPMVTTDVGDVKWLFGNEPGYYISSSDPTSFASNIRKALQFAEKNDRTNGRNRIIALGLDSKVIAQRIIALYDRILKSSKID